MSGYYSPADVANLYVDLGRNLVGRDGSADVFRVLTATAMQRVPGAEDAGITSGTPHDLKTVAATSDRVNRVDQIQYDLRSGPCVDAVLQDQVFHADDLRTGTQWPEFGRRAAESEGIVSMLSFRLYLEQDDGLIAGLNCYATQPHAFDDVSLMIGLLLATHGALAVHAAVKHEKANNLEFALKSSREIGIAMGVLMNQYKVTREQAFDLLRVASQHSHRKLAVIAGEVADTGLLELPSASRS